MKKLLLLTLLSLSITYSQNVAINGSGAAPNASSMLDVNDAARGILIPRVALTATNVAAPVVAPANWLMVFNTATAGVAPNNVWPGMYYWNGTAWVRVLSNTDAWNTSGNFGTVAGTNFAGTADNVTFDIRTNNLLRMRIFNTGEAVVNNATTFAGDVFSSYGTGTNSSINGYISGTGAGFAGYFENTSTAANSYAGYVTATNGITLRSASLANNINFYADATNNGANTQNGTFILNSTNTNSGNLDIIQTNATSIGWNLYGDVASTTYNKPVAAFIGRNVTTGTAVAGSVNTAGIINTLAAGSGGAFVHPTTGVYGRAIDSTSTFGGQFTNMTNTTTIPNGAGVTSRGYNTGIYASAGNTASGIGGNFSGNNVGVYTSANGAGVIGAGTRIGVNGIGSNVGNGIGAVFTGNNLVGALPANGAGVSTTGDVIGIFAETSGNTNGDAAGIFQRNGGTFIVRVCENNGGTDQKIRGTGAVSTVVKDTDGNEVTMFATEAPEVLFQDYGQGQLINGIATIAIDPTFASNVTIDENHPLRVFVQLEGDCKGVFITNKSASGFTVKELDGGTSNVSFTYTIVANRADRIENGEKLSEFDDVRFLKTSTKINTETLEYNVTKVKEEPTNSIKKENRNNNISNIEKKKNSIRQ